MQRILFPVNILMKKTYQRQQKYCLSKAASEPAHAEQHQNIVKAYCLAYSREHLRKHGLAPQLNETTNDCAEVKLLYPKVSNGDK